MELWVLWIAVAIPYGLLFLQGRVLGRLAARIDLTERALSARRAGESEKPDPIGLFERRVAAVESTLSALRTDFENHLRTIGPQAHSA